MDEADDYSLRFRGGQYLVKERAYSISKEYTIIIMAILYWFCSKLCKLLSYKKVDRITPDGQLLIVKNNVF